VAPNLRFFLTVIIAAGSCPLFAESTPPQWIWLKKGDRHEEKRWETSHGFSLDRSPKYASLRVVADYAGLKILLNGQMVLALDPYDPTQELEVTRFLREGVNDFSIIATGTPGPSAIAVELFVQPDSGEILRIPSGSHWNDKDLRSFGPVDPSRWALNKLPDVSPFAEYNQWKEALSEETASLSPLPPGFEIDKVRDAADGEDSWVSLAIDPEGRMLIGMEQKGILRLTLSDNGAEAVDAAMVNNTLAECRGLVWSGDRLYAHANNNKALYALRDTDGDDRFDEVSLIQSTVGGVGHGRNDLTLHEGAVHLINGDDIDVPATSPRRAPPERGAPKELGHWIRHQVVDGQVVWEAMNRGLRNPYGVDFNSDGEAFTYDADNEGDVGLPFYRPTRINHLVSGANYGWHQEQGNTRSFPIYAPDNVPTNFDVGRGSPTGVKFGTRSHFPSPWKEALFALDWAYGRIVAVHLTPHGASYLGSGQVFLEGRPLNVTDLDFDAKGAMWFITGGRKTKSSLYRVRYTGEEIGSARPGEHTSQNEAYSAAAREIRKRIEHFHGRKDATALAGIWPYLGDPDPWLRSAARVALEWQPVETWRAKALNASADTGGLTALLALARSGSDEDRAEVRRVAAALLVRSDASRIDKLTLMRVHELAGYPGKPAERAVIASQLHGLLPDLSEPVHRELARAFIAVDAPDAVEFSLDRLAVATTQMERLHYLEALSAADTGWQPAQQQVFFTALAHAKRYSSGDRFLLPFFQRLEESALKNIDHDADRIKFAAILDGEAENIVTAMPRPFVKHWTMGDFPAHETGSAPDLKRGQELYTAVLCAACHVAGTTGRPVGPDLTMVASRFGRRDLLESILEPSQVVAEVHRNVMVTKNNESVVLGRIVQNDFRASTLTLSTNPFAPSELVTIPKSEIRSWEESPVSPMPPALLDSLTKEEINDLLGFLISGGHVD
jgi:putative heme-binding domain-containing protein